MKRPFLCLLSALVPAVPAAAQWSSDPAVNLSVADAASDQILPKLAPTADGGVYVSWYDGIAGGFDVRVQKLDAAGNELFAHNGVLVADRGFSSVQDYGLSVDTAGNALLAFRDDSGTGVQVAAAAVSPAGTTVWSLQLTATSQFVASPRITGTSDGGAVVAWTQDADAVMQKLDSSGVPQWGPGVTLSPGAGSYSPSDVHASGTGAIVSFVHQTGGFGSPRHLLAQKLDSAGNPLWGAAHVAVFDGGSLQLGNFPGFEPDGSGGAVFGWYSSSPSLQCFAQRLDANGVEQFAHNGTPASTNATRIRVNPSVAYDAGTGETFLFFVEQNGTQSQFGLYGQKFNASGARQWTDDGAALIGLGSTEIGLVRCLDNAGGASVFWASAPSFGQDTLHGARVAGTGVFDLGPFDTASTPSGKQRLAAARSTAGHAVLAWTDDRVDAGDVLAQNVNKDGTLGSAEPGTASCFGVGCPCGNDDATAGCANSTGSGGLLGGSGSTSVTADDLVLTATQLPTGQQGLFYMGSGVVSNQLWDGLQCALGASTFRFLGSIQSSGGTGEMTYTGFAADAPAQIVSGTTWHFHCWHRDVPGTPCGTGANFSNLYSVTFTP